MVNTLAQAGFKADPQELSERFGMKLHYEAPAAPAGFAMSAEPKKKDDLSAALEAWLGPYSDTAALIADLIDDDSISKEEKSRKIKALLDAAGGDSSAFEKLQSEDMNRLIDDHKNQR